MERAPVHGDTDQEGTGVWGHYQKRTGVWAQWVLNFLK